MRAGLPRRTLLIALFGWMPLAGACGRGDGGRAGEPVPPRQGLAQVRDSAGVEIVEYAGAPTHLPVAFRISETPTLDLGGQRGNPDHELTPRSAFHYPTRLPDGRWVVPDGPSLKVFDAQGRFVQQIGRGGQGPGEFKVPRRVCVAPPDTIVAIDDGMSRVSFFDAAGRFVRSFDVRDGYPADRGCFEDGLPVVVADTRPDSDNPPYLIATLRRVNRDGVVQGNIADVPYGSRSVVVQSATNVVPFREHVYTGDGTWPEVRIYHRDGRLVRVVRWNAPRIPVTDELFERLVGLTLPGGNLEEKVARMRARPHPTTLPTYQAIVVDDAGRIWVMDSPDYDNLAARRPSEPWTVFETNGRPLGRVYVPAFNSGWIDIRAVGEDNVVLHWTDDLGFVHLTFHTLERVASP